MKKRYDDIGDDEIRIIGSSGHSRMKRHIAIVVIVPLLVIICFTAALIIWDVNDSKVADNSDPIDVVIYGEEPTSDVVEPLVGALSMVDVESGAPGFTEIRDTTINDVPLRVYIPHNAAMELHVGKMDREDKGVIYAAEAAFIRADNHAILGAFVLKGEPLAWGLSMRGYCASIDGEVTIGVADNSPLFEEAINRGGYFFRQYPLVDNGVFVKNEPKNKSVRRAICERVGEIFMVESLTKESFHDFTQALVDLGVDNAVNLAGSEAYGWALDSEGMKHEFGTPNYYTGRGRMPKNTNYIVWRHKSFTEEHSLE